jgi:AcrR family transcriptional regulator
MSIEPKRVYSSPRRNSAAEATKERVLAVARDLFARDGIDKVTIAQIAAGAEVAASTVFALFKSKEGLLRALMTAALFGTRFREAQCLLEGVRDPVQMVALSASIALAIYESETVELGLLRGASGFSPALRKLEQEFEDLRFAMQEDRLRKLFEAGKARRGLAFEEARRILWMYTSRDVYRMLVQDGGWPPGRYRDWLSRTLIEALVEP